MSRRLQGRTTETSSLQTLASADAPFAPPPRVLPMCPAMCVSPVQWDKDGFLQEVSAPHHLRHVDPNQIHDASKPAIPADAHVGESPAKAVLQQIDSGDVPALKHVQPPPQ